MNYNEDLNSALKTLKEGGIILYPTDTIWGLGCDATNNDAVDRIFRIKNRKESRSLIILVNGLTMLERYVTWIPEAAFNILEVSDKPVTIIYPSGRNLAAGVYAGDGSAGVRICNDNFCKELITRFRRPVVSTSANISGAISPSNFSEIDENIVRSADYVVEHRRKDKNRSTPSSVIKFDRDGTIQIIRE